MGTYREWTPIENIPRRLYCEGLHNDYQGFRVLLKGERKDACLIQIAFESVLAYRSMDEGDRLRTLQGLPKDRQSSLFMVENSDWICWFHEESCDIHRDRDIKHYAIYTSNDCIDVICIDPPLVTWCDG